MNEIKKIHKAVCSSVYPRTAVCGEDNQGIHGGFRHIFNVFDKDWGARMKRHGVLRSGTIPCSRCWPDSNKKDLNPVETIRL